MIGSLYAFSDLMLYSFYGLATRSTSAIVLLYTPNHKKITRAMKCWWLGV